MPISTEYEFTFPSRTKTENFYVSVSGDCLVSYLLVDSGDGYRPLSPLEVEVDGSYSRLPFALIAGTHRIRLMGEPFDGTALLITGFDLQNIIAVDTQAAVESSESLTRRRELAIGIIDGMNNLFESTVSFVAQSTCLRINGISQTLGAHYGESGNKKVTLNFFPAVGDTVEIEYTQL